MPIGPPIGDIAVIASDISLPFLNRDGINWITVVAFGIFHIVLFYLARILYMIAAGCAGVKSAAALL
jgi:hypothetical protein